MKERYPRLFWLVVLCLAAGAMVATWLLWRDPDASHPVDLGAPTSRIGDSTPPPGADARDLGHRQGSATTGGEQLIEVTSGQDEASSTDRSREDTAYEIEITVIAPPLDELQPAAGDKPGFKLTVENTSKQVTHAAAAQAVVFPVTPDARRGSVVSCSADGYESLSTVLRFSSPRQRKAQVTFRPRRLCSVSVQLVGGASIDLAARRVRIAAGRSWLIGDPPAPRASSAPKGGESDSQAPANSAENESAESTVTVSPARRSERMLAELGSGARTEVLSNASGLADFGFFPEGTDVAIHAYGPGVSSDAIRAVVTYPVTALELTVASANSVVVTVTRDGQPAPKVFVRAVRELPKLLRVEGVTDADGTWWFEPSGLGDYTFLAFGEAGAISATHRCRVAVGDTAVRFEVTESDTLEAVFQDQFGNPIAGLPVEAWGRELVFGVARKTDASGRAFWPIPVGEKGVSLKIAGGTLTDSAEGEFTSESIQQIASKAITMPSEPITCILERKLGEKAAGTLRIYFDSRQNMPETTPVQVFCEYLTWAAVAPSKLEQVGVTRLSSTMMGARIAATSGKYIVSARVSHNGREYGGEVTGIIVTGGIETVARVVLTPIVSSVSLKLTLPDGKPLDAGRVLVNGRRIESEFKVSSNGVVNITDVPEGEHELTLTGTPYLLSHTNAYRISVDSRSALVPLEIQVINAPVQLQLKIPAELGIVRVVGSPVNHRVGAVSATLEGDEWVFRSLHPGAWAIIASKHNSPAAPEYAYGLIDVKDWVTSANLRIEERRVVLEP